MEQHTILVVDDDEPTVDLIGRILWRAGHRAVAAFNGREGLEACVAERPALVLTGIIMPEMGGDELIRRLRAHPTLHDIPILVVTGQSKPEQFEAWYAAGANKCLPKPFVHAELVAAVAELLGHAAG